MAYLANPLDEEENKKLALSGSGGGSNILAGSGGAGGLSTGAAQAPKAGSGWVNLNTYLDANKGGGEKIANTITGTADTVVKDARDQNTNFRGAAQSQIDKGTIQRDDNLISNIKTNPLTASHDAYKRATGTYGGPVNAEGAKDYSRVKNINDTAEQYRTGLQNADTQTAILEKTFKGRKPLNANDAGNYGRGMANLDSFIVQAEPTANPAFKAYQDRTAGFKDEFGAASTLLNDYVKRAQATSLANKSLTQDAVGDSRKGIMRGISDSLGTREQAAKEQVMSGSQAKRDAISSRYGGLAGTTDFVAPKDKYGINHAMTSDERARLQALSELDGSQGPGDVSANPYAFDEGAYEASLKAEQEKRAAAKIAEDEAADREREAQKRQASPEQTKAIDAVNAVNTVANQPANWINKQITDSTGPVNRALGIPEEADKFISPTLPVIPNVSEGDAVELLNRFKVKNPLRRR